MPSSPPDGSRTSGGIGEDQLGSGGWLVAAVAVSLVFVAILMRQAGLSLAMSTPGALAVVGAFVLLGTVRWRCRRSTSGAARSAGEFAEYVGLSTAIALVGAVASYPVAAFSHGFADASLQRWDEALHFDWLAWYRFTAAHPALQLVSRGAYEMIYVSPALLLGFYAVTGRRRSAYEFMGAIWVSAVLTLVAFLFMPAIGPFAYLWHAPIPYMPVSDLWQPEIIPKLRAHDPGQIDLGHLVGLVSAPSFHAAAAVVLIAFAARERRIGVPLVVANVAMLLSTPVEGTHYLIDLVLGAVVALCSIGIIVAARGEGRKAIRARRRRS